MEKHSVVGLDNIALIQQNEINNNAKIIKFFLQGYSYIYVCKSDFVFVGLISFGDFLKDIINKNPKSVILNENEYENKIKEFFEKFPKFELPVLNESGALIEVIKKKKNPYSAFDNPFELINKSEFEDFFRNYKKVYITNPQLFGILENFDFESVGIEIIDFNLLKEENIFELKHSNNNIIVTDSYEKFNNIKFSFLPKLIKIDELFLKLISKKVMNKFKNKKIEYYYFESPIYKKVKNYRKDIDKDIIKKTIEQLSTDEKTVNELFFNSGPKEFILKGDYTKVWLIRKDGMFLMENCQSKYLNVKNNIRITTNSPENFTKTIWVFGTCIVRGFLVDDDNTIPSILQHRLIKEGYLNVRVLNIGGGGGMNSKSDIKDFVNMMSMDIIENDIVIHLGYKAWQIEEDEIQVQEKKFSTSHLLEEGIKEPLFFNHVVHLSDYGNEIISNYIWDKLDKDLLRR